MIAQAELPMNYIAGDWVSGTSSEWTQVVNPASGEVLASVPLADRADVDAAVQAAQNAFPAWRETPPEDRIQFLFRFKNALEANFEEIARITTAENGKTLQEARAELRRGIENVEVACGIPTLMQGYNLEDVARGIDEMMIRQPLGVVAVITPFNFPAMIPLWFLPYAIACGNTLVLKPSERVPLTARRLIQLLEETGLPKGVANMVTGSKTAVDALLDHPAVRAISFVGSTGVAQYIYARGAQNGKRVQCQGGAKNHVVVLPDADFETSAKIIADSAFGCAGQRCLAVSVAITVRDAAKPFEEALLDVTSRIRTGNGMENNVDMGPVISKQSQERIQGLIRTGIEEGGKQVFGGGSVPADGSFIPPTILSGIGRDSSLTENEIFGPVLALQAADDLDDAIALLAKNRYGNASSIFTSSGAAARKFRYYAPTGNIGVNIGVAAPMAYFPFSGWKDSFLGVLHGQGRDAVEFYTDKKVVIERWPKEWSRKF